eukprot:2931628-Pyramimonas_sp.AAC.1
MEGGGRFAATLRSARQLPQTRDEGCLPEALGPPSRQHGRAEGNGGSGSPAAGAAAPFGQLSADLPRGIVDPR